MKGGTGRTDHKMLGVPQRARQAAALVAQHLRAVLDLRGALGGSRGPRPPQRRSRRALRLRRAGLRAATRARCRAAGRAEPSAAPHSLAARHCGARRDRLQTAATLIGRLRGPLTSLLEHFASRRLWTMTLPI